MDKTKGTRTEVASEDFEQIFVKEKDLTVTSKTSEEIKKKDAPSVQTVTDDSKAHKRLKTVICEISDQVILPSTEQSSMNLELQVSAKTSQIELDNNLLTDIKPEYSIVEESHSQYKGDLSICFACDRQIAEHFKEDTISYKCCKCNYKIKIQNSLVWHICREHLSEPYFCTICKIRFSKENSHESKHPCNACTKIFQCVTQLEVHYSSHEDRHKKICRICQIDIDKHRIKLEDKVFYRCCVCQANREFEKKSNFLVHLCTHSDLKAFKCDQCGDRFKVKYDVTLHSKIHPKCRICGQRFVDRNSVDAHILEKHR